MVNCNQKGKRVERYNVKWLRDRGVLSAKRTEQYCGKGGTSDIEADVELPSFHIESKGTANKKLTKSKLKDWYEQLYTDVKDGRLPVILHVANGEEPIALIPIDTALKMKLEVLTIKGVSGSSFDPFDDIKNDNLNRKIFNAFSLGLPDLVSILAYEVAPGKIFLATDGSRFLREMIKYEETIRVEARPS